MPKKLSISLAVVVLLAVIGAFAIYLWDKNYDNEIADGVTIGGVDVGGLTAEDAAAQLRANLVTPLDKDVVVRYGDEKYKLDSKDLNVHTDIDEMVDEAVQVSEEDGILTRTW